jgi:hypothetical protein
MFLLRRDPGHHHVPQLRGAPYPASATSLRPHEPLLYRAEELPVPPGLRQSPRPRTTNHQKAITTHHAAMTEIETGTVATSAQGRASRVSCHERRALPANDIGESTVTRSDRRPPMEQK